MQAFWAALALLSFDSVQLYGLSLDLLLLLLRRLPLSETTTASVLLAAAPVGDEAELTSALAASVAAQQAAGAGSSGGWGDGGSSSAEGGAAAQQPWVAGQLLPWRALGLLGGPVLGGRRRQRGGDEDGEAPGGDEQAASLPSTAANSEAGSVEAAPLPLAVQQLLWRGLLTPDTCVRAVSALAALAGALAGVAGRDAELMRTGTPLPWPSDHGEGEGGEQPPLPSWSTDPALSRAARHTGFGESGAGSMGAALDAQRQQQQPLAGAGWPRPPRPPSRAAASALHQDCAVLTALLGPVAGQLLCSLLGVMPLLYGLRSGEVAVAASEELEAALQECVLTMAAACQLHGLLGLAVWLPPLLGAPSPAGLASWLDGFALQLARSFLPAHAPWLLRHCVGVLLMPGARQLHAPLLALLAALFRVPGLELGPAGRALLNERELLAPIAALAQVRAVGAALHQACAVDPAVDLGCAQGCLLGLAAFAFPIPNTCLVPHPSSNIALATRHTHVIPQCTKPAPSPPCIPTLRTGPAVHRCT